MTEALIIKNNKIMLGRKKKPGFAQGKLLGFGGKLEKGETIEKALIREFFEETGLKVGEFEKRGILNFSYVDDPEMEVHYFEILKYQGEPKESNEMGIEWYPLNNIPYSQMFPNDRYWLPMFLEKKYFTGQFEFDENYEILKYKIK